MWSSWMHAVPKGFSSTKDQSEEQYYCCEWTYCSLTKQSWLAIGGTKGVVRVVK